MARNLAINKHKDYTEEDISYIEQNIATKSFKQMANHLGRTEEAVCVFANNVLGLRRVDTIDGMTFTEVQYLTGATKSRIRTWKKRGLKYTRNACYSIVKEKDLIEFMQKNRDLWDARDCDKAFFNKYSWFWECLKEDRENNGGRCYRRWTRYEEQDIIRLRKRGLTSKEIAKELGRTFSCVENRIYSMRKQKRI